MGQTNQMYQISTLQALMLGYSRGVVTVRELLRHGEIGLGTFQDVNGEMIALDGKVYKADNAGRVTEADRMTGVPFAAVAFMDEAEEFELEEGSCIEDLKKQLNVIVDADFGLNSMYVLRMEGHFSRIKARSEEGQRSHHVELAEILKKNQKDFMFEDISGVLVALYFPDYMDGINAAGWHFHFVSDDRTKGGHVYELEFDRLKAQRTRLNNIEIQLPKDKAFDTYPLKSVSTEAVKAVEQ